MRNMLVAALAFGMALAFSATANAGALDQSQSFLDIKIGSVPNIRVNASSTGITLSDAGAGHAITEVTSIFQTDSFTIQSSAFTGLPILKGFSGLKLSLHAGSGSFGESASYANNVGVGTVSGFGGVEANSGTLVLGAGGFNFSISLANLGSGGMTTLASVLGNQLVVTGEPFNTGAANITGLDSAVLILPTANAMGNITLGNITGLAFTLNLSSTALLSAQELTDGMGGGVWRNTVVVGGTNNLASATAGGQIKMVAPFRLSTGSIAGNIAGTLTKTFTFVPEPGTVLLLVTGAIGLAIVGRKRMNK